MRTRGAKEIRTRPVSVYPVRGTPGHPRQHEGATRGLHEGPLSRATRARAPPPYRTRPALLPHPLILIHAPIPHPTSTPPRVAYGRPVPRPRTTAAARFRLARLRCRATCAACAGRAADTCATCATRTRARPSRHTPPDIPRPDTAAHLRLRARSRSCAHALVRARTAMHAAPAEIRADQAAGGGATARQGRPGPEPTSSRYQLVAPSRP